LERIITRRPIATVISLTAAGAIALSTVTAVPTETHLSGLAAPHVSTQFVELTAQPLEEIWAIATGADSTYPLPAGASPIAPIAEELGQSLVTYSRQLLTGQGGVIPAEISAQVARVQATGSLVNALLEDDIVAVGLSAFSAVFLTVLVVGSLPASSSALASLPGIWLNGLLYPVLKWTYNAFAIRNTIATALQPTTAQPLAVESTAAVAPKPRTARVSPSRARRATFRAPASAKVATGSPTPPASATRNANHAKSGRAAPQRPRHH
jgi:hypothetical protein